MSMAGVATITEAAAAQTVSGAGSGITEIPQRRAALYAFWTMAILAVVFAIGVAIFGELSFPQQQIAALLRHGTSAANLAAIKAIRDDWYSQLTSLAQLAVFGSIFPIFTSIVGYLLGNAKSNDSN